MENAMELLYEATQHENNYIGKGSFAKVYNIPSMAEYVLRVERNVDKSVFFKYPVTEVKDEFPGYNFGQKVADNNHGITILKKVHGWFLGFANPPEKDDPKKFLPEHAEKVLDQIKEISAFPLTSYENLAKKLQVINQSPNLMLDFANSNNILVDSRNKEFNPLDLSERAQIAELKDIVHDKTEIISLLANACSHIGVYDRLDTDKQRQLIDYTTIVINKCKKAASNTNLKDSQLPAYEKFKRLNDYCIRVIPKDCQLHTRYKAFEDMYRGCFEGQ